MRRFMLSALASLTLVSATASTDAGSIRVRSEGGGVIRGDLGPASGGAVATATTALNTFGERLGAGEATFAMDSVRHSIIGTHIRGREVRGGVPVDGTSAAVHVIDGRIVQVEARASSLPGQSAWAAIDGSSARAIALARLGVTAPTVQPVTERLLISSGNQLVDAWRVSVFSLAPAVAAEVDVAATSGRVLAVRDDRLYTDGTATVFDPNPIQTTKNPNLRQPAELGLPVDADVDSAELTAALVTRPLKGYDSNFLPAGRIVGPYVDVLGTGPIVSVQPNTFTFTRGDPRFETTNAYVAIDAIQRYFQSLGFTGDAAVNAEPQNVYTLRVEGFDNSFYQQGNDIMVFGAGGVDDAEDAEVVIHELGHAIHDAQVPGWGDTHQGGSMGEGWGDFLAGAYYARTSGGFGDLCIADWDATSYSSANPPCLRRLDETKKYPGDMENEVHADGEIWSAFLWDLRSKLGCASQDPSPECAEPRPAEALILSDRIIKLILTSHELLSTTADFGDAVAALMTAANALGHPGWVSLIQVSAAKYGLPLA
ncbi:MAG: M36 family metallopeptidase [Actinomycetota bacterium]